MPSEDAEEEELLVACLLESLWALRFGVIERVRMYSLTSMSSGKTEWKMRDMELMETLLSWSLKPIRFET